MSDNGFVDSAGGDDKTHGRGLYISRGSREQS